MAIKSVFKSYIPSINYVTKGGRNCAFIDSRYVTDHPAEVAELTEEIKSGGTQHLYIDPNESQIDTTLQDKIKEAQLRATLEVMDEYGKLPGSAASVSQTQAQSSQASQTISQVNPVAQSPSMSAATLLNVTSSGALDGLKTMSNGSK